MKYTVRERAKERDSKITRERESTRVIARKSKREKIS